MAIERNSELLYLYDARLCNPNGDPDEENRPRMDYETRRNLVSDVRLKRYLRDYWVHLDAGDWQGLGYADATGSATPQDVWVRREEGEGGPTTVSARQRIDSLARLYSDGASNARQLRADPEFRRWLLGRLIDVRLFGATMPIGEGEGGGRGASLVLTGPVQLAWGYSLNRAEILASSTLSSHFAGRENEYGTFGKDWRVKYALLAFYGTVSAWRARETALEDRDVEVLDRSMLRALPLLATTRSKLGQAPRLYLRVEYHDDQTFLGDLRPLVQLEREEELESLDDVQPRFDDLVDRLRGRRDRIREVVFWAHPDFAAAARLGRELGEALDGVSLREQGE